MVSTDAIIACKSLSIPEQRKFCICVINGGIHGRDVHKAIEYISSRSEDGKKAILNGTVSYDKDRHYIESLHPLLLQILDKITQKLTKTEVIQEAVKKEYPNFTSEIFQLIRILFRELDPSYIDNIEDGTERKQAYSDEDISYAEHTRYMVKREKIDDTLYSLILKQLNFAPKIVEHLKEDGHNYAFESEYQSPKQRELREKLRKVDTTRKDPLKALA